MRMTDLMVAARQRLDAALEALGPELGALVIDVCGFLKGLETVEAEHAWPAVTPTAVSTAETAMTSVRTTTRRMSSPLAMSLRRSGSPPND